MNSCVGTATTLNEPPTAQTAEATHNRRYAAMASGRRSIVYARTADVLTVRHRRYG
ncbi:hypothetical protein [Micromonospora vulcania]|uniref:Uncharacterized protein n=1 Tax=Micromonospora vulcania TaxID=1441873 RepID=A0ABW1HH18_9ACTN